MERSDDSGSGQVLREIHLNKPFEDTATDSDLSNEGKARWEALHRENVRLLKSITILESELKFLREEILPMLTNPDIRNEDIEKLILQRNFSHPIPNYHVDINEEPLDLSVQYTVL